MVKLQLTFMMVTAFAVADSNEEADEVQEAPSVWNNWNGNPEAGSYFD